MRFRKALSVLLTVTMMTGMSAGMVHAENEKVTLRVLSANEAMDETMMQEFMDENPNIEIEYEYVSAADAPTRISALLTAGELPDVFQTQASMYSDLVKEGQLLDLTEALDGPSYEGDMAWKDTYEEGLLENCENALKSGGVESDTYSYGVPMGMITVAVLYDKSIYQELSLEVPETWEEFTANLDVLKNAGYSALAVQNNTCLDWFPRLFWDQYCREEIEEEGKNFEDGSMTFQTDSVKEAMVQYKALYDAGYFPENYLTGTLEEMEHLFIQGELAQLMVTPDKIQYILDNAPEGMQLASYALPGINGLPSRSLGGISLILVGNANTEHPEETTTLLKYLTSKTNFEKNQKLQLTSSGLKGVQRSTEYVDIVEGYEQAGIAGFIPEIFVPTTINSEINTTFRGDLVQNYLLGNYDLDTVCDTLQDMYEEYLESISE